MGRHARSLQEFASMWPRLGRRGRPDISRTARRTGAGFNVATAWTPWKTDSLPPESTNVYRLQCGHGLDAVEDEERGGLIDVGRPASMWPRLGRRGRRPVGDRREPVLDASMWPRLGRRGRHPITSKRGPILCRFNVATAWTPWKTSRATRSPSPPPRFNVATAWTPWKTPGERTMPVKNTALQCGHGLDAVEDGADRGLGIPAGRGLQCGHGLDAVEDASHGHRDGSRRHPSMLPRLGRRGRPCRSRFR